MSREFFSDLAAFIAVAEEGSFTRAAAKLGMSQSALSQLIRNFEQRIGVRLLTRTTRSVSATEAGRRLLKTAMPRYQDIEEELIAIRELRDTPSGTLRITTTEHAADTVLWPRIGIFMQKYPDIHIEIAIDYGLSDIVAERFDMGIRLGDEVAKDMIAVRIGPDIQFCAVASPDYLSARKRPNLPQDLVQHRCINFRLPTYGEMYAWELSREKETVRIRVDGQLTVNGLYQALTAIRAGLGIGFIPYDVAQKSLADGTLVAVLEEWMPTFPGFHLYYPDRQKSRAASLLIEALRFSGAE